MSIKCGFFNSINKDRPYFAEDMNHPYKLLVSNGVFATPNGTPSDLLQVLSAGDGLKVNVNSGRGIFHDKWFVSDEIITFNIEANNGISPRMDSIVVRVNENLDVRAASIELIKGVISDNPIPPALSDDEFTFDYRLANILVNPSVSEITQADITDTRGSGECPWITSLIQQVDTSTLFLQWQTAHKNYYNSAQKEFNDWFRNIKDTLATTTMIRTYTSSYTTTSNNETLINIDIENFDDALDILNVFVNGLKLILGVDYIINEDGKSITLTNGVDAGTLIAFEVYKSVDGSDAVSVVDDVLELEKYKPRVKRDVTILTSDWAENGDYYEAVITNAEITADDIVDVNIKINSMSIANDAGILNITESAAGSVTIYAESIPAADLIVDLIIQKGKVV